MKILNFFLNPFLTQNYWKIWRNISRKISWSNRTAFRWFQKVLRPNPELSYQGIVGECWRHCICTARLLKLDSKLVHRIQATKFVDNKTSLNLIEFLIARQFSEFCFSRKIWNHFSTQISTIYMNKRRKFMENKLIVRYPLKIFNWSLKPLREFTKPIRKILARLLEKF